MKVHLPFWQRLLITVGVMLLASYLAGLLCQSILGIPIPSYVAGVVGGLATLPAWYFLKRGGHRSTSSVTGQLQEIARNRRKETSI